MTTQVELDGQETTVAKGRRRKAESEPSNPVMARMQLSLFNAQAPAQAPPIDPARPVSRDDCRHGVRPCPWTTCEFWYRHKRQPACRMDDAEREARAQGVQP